MDLLDLGLLVLGIYLAVMILIRLMKKKHEQMLTDIRTQWQAQQEKERKKNRQVF